MAFKSHINFSNEDANTPCCMRRSPIWLGLHNPHQQNFFFCTHHMNEQTNKQMNELVDDFINRVVSKEASQPASSSPHKGSLEYEFEIQTAKTN